ncbi:hypothetical protein QTP88_006820 [Uroleucon formosanum]
MNLKRPQEGQFQINSMSLRAHPEEFTKYYRMYITTFDELISLVRPYLPKVTNMRSPISEEGRLTITLRVIDVGSYGKESDCNAFKTSALGKKLNTNRTNFPANQYLPNYNLGVPQPFVLVVDEAFALHKNLLRPFPGRSLNGQRRIFNYRLSRARQYIECSFGIMSKKWIVFMFLVIPMSIF